MLPRNAGDALPAGVVGAAVGIADRYVSDLRGLAGVHVDV